MAHTLHEPTQLSSLGAGEKPRQLNVGEITPQSAMYPSPRKHFPDVGAQISTGETLRTCLPRS